MRKAAARSDGSTGFWVRVANMKSRAQTSLRNSLFVTAAGAALATGLALVPVGTAQAQDVDTCRDGEDPTTLTEPENSLECGDGAEARASNSTAIGDGAVASAENSIALGAGSLANEENTLSIGQVGSERRIVNVADGEALTDAATVGQVQEATQYIAFRDNDTDPLGSATANGEDSTAMGPGASAGAKRSVAIGNGAKTIEVDPRANYGDNSYSVAIGTQAEAHAYGTVTIGATSRATGRYATAVGDNAKALADGASAFGGWTQANAANSIALGADAKTEDPENGSANGSIAIGQASGAFALGAVAIGRQSIADEANTVSFGRLAVEDDPDTVDIDESQTAITRRLVNLADGEALTDAATFGQVQEATQYIAFTNGAARDPAAATGANSTAIGPGASAGAATSVAIGNGAQTQWVDPDGGNNQMSIAIGYQAETNATQAIALGADTQAYGTGSMAVGDYSKAHEDDSVALGQEAQGYAQNSISLGASAIVRAGANSGIAIGKWAEINEDSVQAIAVGWDATVSAPYSIALGSKAKVFAENSVAIGQNSLVQEDEDYVVSFGRDETSAGVDDAVKRRLVHLADGQDDSDAVTMAQLNAVSTSGTTYMATSFDGDAASATGTSSFAVGEGALAQGTGSIAIGGDAPGDDPDDNGAQALGNYSFALGANAKAASLISVAIGAGANAEGVASLAIGTSTSALGGGAVALGNRSGASGDASTAIGAQSSADSAFSVAIGYQAETGAQYAAAIGPLASAGFANSMAIGFEAATTRANQFMLGTASYTYTLPGLSQIASNDAQEGALYYVTVDAEGNLGFETTPITQTASVATPSNAKSTVLAAANVSSSEVSPQVTPAGFDYLDVNSSEGVATANGDNAIALGAGAQTQAEGAIAIGFNSLASDADTVSFGRAPSSEGAEDGITRRLVNVADGINTSDVATVGQLQTATSDLDYIAVSNVGDAFGPASVWTGSRPNNNNSIALGPGAYIGAFANHAVAIGAGSVATDPYTVSFGSAADGITRKLTNVATGAVNEDSTDAVNGSQLAALYSAIGAFGQRFTDLSIAIGENLGAINSMDAAGLTYVATSFEGNAASAAGDNSVAIGAGALAEGIGSMALGGDAPGDDPDENGAQALGNYSFALGANAQAKSLISFAIGAGATAEGVASLAIGTSSEALGGGAVALGNLSAASGDASTAIGAQSDADSAYSIAVGYQAATGAQYAAAIGPLANASHLNSMAIGYQAATTRANQIVIGTTTQSVTLPSLSQASLVNAQSGELFMVTVDADGNLGFAAMPGTTSTATAASSAAAPFASNASAPASSAAQQSTAAPTSSSTPTTSSLAYDATSTDGGPTSSAQSGERIASAENTSSRSITDSEDRNLPEQMELADAGGNASETAEQESGQLAQSDPDQNVPEPPTNPDTSAGTRTASTSASGNSALVAAVTEEQFNSLAGSVSSLEGRVSSLESNVETLFDLTETIDRDARRGIAAIAAQAHPHFPSEPGKTSYASNVATYRGEVGVSVGLMHRFEGDFAISAGVTYAGGNSTSVRAGIAGEF